MPTPRDLLTAGGPGSRRGRVWAAAVVTLALAGCANRGDWRAGWAREPITPPFPTPLAGYSRRGSAPARGVTDPLVARALVLEDASGRRVAIVACDLIGMTAELKAAVVARLSPRDRIGADALLLCATHTHSGPGGASDNPLAKLGSGDAEPRLPPFLAGRIAAAVDRAAARLVRCRLALTDSPLPGLAKNRRRPDGPVDGRLGTLAVRPVGGGAGVLVASFAMHPTVLPASQMEYSADFPGAYAAAVEAAGWDLAVFLNGAEGDQAPVGVPGATPRAAVGVIGGRLAAAALAAAAGPATVLPPRLAVHRRDVTLPPSLFAAWVPRAATVQAVTLGPLLLYAVPGEPVAELGAEFRLRAAALGFPAAWLVALANDHLGYFDTPTGFARNSYESNLTFAGPRAGRALLDALPAALDPGRAPAADREARAREAGLLAGGSARRRGGGWFVRLSGSPRAMGFQHGRLLRAPILDLEARWRAWLDAQAGDTLRAGPPLLALALAPVRPSALLMPWLGIKARELQPFIAPDLLEEIDGIAEGAGLPYDEVLVMNVFLTMAEQEDRAHWFFSGPRGTCTNVACLPPRAAGETLVARNLDWGMEDLLPAFAAVFLCAPAAGRPFLSVGWAGQAGTLTAMNADGLTLTEESIAAHGDTRYHGEPLQLLLRRVIQTTGTLAAAVDALRTAPGTCGYHLMVVDGRARSARVVERSATRAVVRRPRGGELPGVVLARDPADYAGGALPPAALPRSDASSDRRYARLGRHLADHPDVVTPEFLRAVLGDAAGGLAGKGTLHSVVFAPERFAAWVAHGTVPAPAGGFEFFDGRAELGGRALPAAVRGRLAAALGPSPAWDRIDEDVAASLQVSEAPAPGRPFRVAHLTMPSTVGGTETENATLHALLYEPAAGVAGTVLFLPMWKGRPRDAEDVIARALARRGFRVAVMPMAWQWWRAPPGVRSGARTLSADPAATRASIIQTCADAERLARWLTARDPAAAGRIALMGLSLGGFTASSLFGLDPRFACGIFILAGGRAADALYSGAPDVREIRRELDARGTTPAEVRRAYAALAPAALADPARGARVLLVNALFDQVVSWENAEALARAWGAPERFRVPGGHHTAVLFLDPFLDRCEAHLRRWASW